MIAVTTIADVGEFGLIRLIRERLVSAGVTGAGANLVLGAGDDAAVVSAPDGRVVATTDLLLEGRHFRRDWSPPRDIGHKAAARNLADVAAMGARPTALLLGFAAPGELDLAWVAELIGGLVAECAGTGAVVAGGDTSSFPSIMLAITALGDLAGRPPVTRSGAREGDVVALAGTLGAAAAGLELLAAGPEDRRQADRDGDPDAAAARLVAAHRRPAPPYEAGPRASIAGATSMIDISDGLIADLGHVADESHVRIEIVTADLFCHPGVITTDLAAAAASLHRDGWADWVLTGGEDHALAATFPPGAAMPTGWHVIGGVARGSGVRVDGERWPGPGGWDHFGSDRC